MATDFVTYEYLFRNGRLGNQLWQIASTAGTARAEGAEPRFPAWEYEKYFNVPAEFFDGSAKGRDLGTDYLQELHYFDAIVSDVRQWFEPTDLVEDELIRRYPWFYDIGHFTAVHVRRGDYVKLPQHFPAPSLDYYRNAIALAVDTAPHTSFVVFSDDIDWCKENLAPLFDGQRVHFASAAPRPVEIVDRLGEPEDQYDLFLMSLCDLHIISNSTFSWWGAFLSDSTCTIYPSIWFGPALDNQPCPAPATWQAISSC